MASTIKVTNINTPDGTGNITLDRPLAGGVTLAGDVTINSGDLVFSTAGKGVCLGVTSNTDANTLDDYEEGNWTPNLTDGSNNATHASNNLGSYVKIGRVVFISCTLSTSAIGSVSGSIKCSGLPFTVYNSNLGFAVYAGSGGNMALGTAGYSMSGNFNANTTDLAIYTWDVTTGTSAMQHSEWGGGMTQMTFAGHYFV